MSAVHRLFEADGNEDGDPFDRLRSVIELAQIVGIDRHALCRALEAAAAERVSMWLVGLVDESLNYDERHEVVRYRLSKQVGTAMTQQDFDNLVEKVVSAQITVATAMGDRKAGISSIGEPIADDLLSLQESRCAVCGVPLRSGAVRSCAYFEDGVEPVVTEHLDHTLPFYWGGNDGNIRLLCSDCNTLKNDLIGVQEDGLVFTFNHIRARGKRERYRRSAYWALESVDVCAEPACAMGAKDGIRLVSIHDPKSPTVVGNMVVHCFAHAPQTAVWVHDRRALRRWE